MTKYLLVGCLQVYQVKKAINLDRICIFTWVIIKCFSRWIYFMSNPMKPQNQCQNICGLLIFQITALKFFFSCSVHQCVYLIVEKRCGYVLFVIAEIRWEIKNVQNARTTGIVKKLKVIIRRLISVMNIVLNCYTA